MLHYRESKIITEVIVVVLKSFLEEAQKLMHEIFEDEMKLDFVGIPDSEYMETADSLRAIKDKIKVCQRINMRVSNLANFCYRYFILFSDLSPPK